MDFPSPLHPGTPKELQTYYDAFDTTLQTTIEACVPLKHTCWASNPWWSPELEIRHRAYIQKCRRWQRTHHREDKVTANAHQRALRQTIASAKRDSWRRFFEEATEENLWDAFKKVTHTRGPHRIGALEVDGQQLYGDAHKAAVLVQKFFPSPSGLDSAEHLDIEDHVTTLLSWAPSHPVPGVTAHEIHSAIRALGAWKAVGPDHVLNLCLRECESILLPHLVTVFSVSLQCQFLPRQRWCAKVLAMLKPGGDPSLPKGYGPISLLSCISKLLERIVIDRLTFSFET